MNWKNRLTNYNFWISIFSAILLILQALKIEFDIAYVNEIFTAVLGLLVVIGIISDPTKTLTKNSDNSVNVNESKTDEKVVEKEVKEEIKLPTENKNETNNVDIKDDLQNVLITITNSLEEKLKKIEELKFDENINNTNEEKNIEESSVEATQVCDEMPAVAENENPYFDVVN